MTDTQQNKDKAIDKLAKSLDGSNSQKATAIAAFVDGRIDKALKSLTPVVQDIVQQHRSTVRQVNDIPAEQRDPKVVDKVKEVSDKKVKPVVEQANQLIARRKAGEEVAPEEIVKVAEEAEKAKEAVDEAGGLVAGQLKKLQLAVNDHKQMLAPRSDGKRPPSRFDGMERDITSMKADIDQLKAGRKDLQVVSSTALASAQARSQGNAWRRAGQWAFAAFAATFVLYFFLWVGPIDNWSWGWALGLPSIVAGVIGAVVFTLSLEEGPSARTVSTANAIAAKWNEGEQSHGSLPVTSSVASRSEWDAVPYLKSESTLPREARAHASASTEGH